MQLPPDETSLLRIFRGLLVADVVLTLLTLLLSLIGGAMVEESYASTDSQNPQETVFLLAFVGLLMLMVLAVLIVSWIGLFLYQNWARWLYLGLNLGLSLIFLPFAALDLSPQWGLATSVGTLGSLCTGAVLTLLFLTPVARRYQAAVNRR
jgi:cell division protein FtsW (lipid II flippase)